MNVTDAETGRVEQFDDPLRSNVLAMTTVIAERLPYFRRIAMRCLDNAADAEDAVQDAFLAAWKHLGEFRGQAQMSTWLTAIVINASRNVVRKRGRVRLVSIDGQEKGENNAPFSELLPDRRPDPEAQLRNLEYERRLHHLSAHLSPTLRVVVQMRSIEGLSVRETAGTLGVTESVVKSRASRALAKLRRMDRKTSRPSSIASAATREANGSASLNAIEPGPRHPSRIGLAAASPRNTMQ